MKKIKFAMIANTFFIMLLLIVSCSKEKIEKCRGNCANIIISGKVWDSSNRKGLANTTVKIYWQDAGVCYICPEDVIGTSKTDGEGNFYINMSIDSSRFHGNRLHIEAPLPGGYIANGSYNGVLRESIGQYNQSFQNIKFTMYQAAKLNIKLTRTQTDNYIGFELYYLFDFTRGEIYGYFGPPPSLYTDFNVTAAANVYTKVSWQKWLSPGVTSTFVDSIKCIVAGPNTITLNY
ncbi:MAG TPA: hypothetical protein VK492_16090 [Chitinophagaceae bacterium]|nr:hypothetical protein [Chitinophagaceae bacterium]